MVKVPCFESFLSITTTKIEKKSLIAKYFTERKKQHYTTTHTNINTPITNLYLEEWNLQPLGILTTKQLNLCIQPINLLPPQYPSIRLR